MKSKIQSRAFDPKDTCNGSSFISSIIMVARRAHHFRLEFVFGLEAFQQSWWGISAYFSEPLQTVFCLSHRLERGVRTRSRSGAAGGSNATFERCIAVPRQGNCNATFRTCRSFLVLVKFWDEGGRFCTLLREMFGNVLMSVALSVQAEFAFFFLRNCFSQVGCISPK